MAFLLRPPDLRESLTDNLADLGRFRKRVAVATAFFRFIAVVVGCATLACVLDSLLHFPPLARALALVLTLTLGGVFWLRGVSRALALRTDALSVALELEGKYPNLNDALASAVDFLEAGEAESRGLSNRLQETAVKQARRLADRHDLDQLARVAACWRAGWTCGLVLAIAIPLVMVNGERATTALTRLADPFGRHAWPTKTRVEIQTPAELPARLPRGEGFDLRFVVRAVLPDRAVVTFRIAEGEEFHEEYPLTAGNEPKYGSNAAVVSARVEGFRLPASFAFRIVANDYDSDWQRVEVVPPPRLVPINGRPTPQFQVVPPAYTGRPPLDIDLPDSEQWLEIPVGSVVRMRAATDVRLSAAVLTFTGDRSAVAQAAGLAHLGHTDPLAALGSAALAGAVGGDIPVSLDESGRVLTAEFSSAMTGPYALRLTDETGLTASRTVRLRITPDPAPTVLLMRPSPGKDPTILTPAASVFVHMTADDSVYALRRTFLEYRVGRDGAIRTIPLEDVRELARALPAVASGLTASARLRPNSARPAPRLFPLSAFTREDGSPLRSGDLLILRGAADDWDDVTVCKEPGRSGDVEIAIAAPEGIDAWLQKNLSEVRKDLARLQELQQQARQKAGEVVVKPDGSLAPADRDKLLASEQTQRQVRAKISDVQEGLRAKVDLLRETVRANNLPRTNTTDRVEAVVEHLGRLADRDLPVIEPSLRQARELGVQPPRPGEEGVLPDLLRTAARHQKAVDEGLTDLIDLLAVWGAAGDIRTAARILRDFILRQAADVEKMDLKPSAADLDRAGTRAEQAAEQARQLISRAWGLVEEKDATAAKAATAAKQRGDEAAALRLKANALPPGTPDKSAMNAKASLLEGERDDLLAAAKVAGAEADALRKGIDAAGGEGLKFELKKAAETLRMDQRSLGLDHLKSAAARLDRLIAALTEKPVDEAPDLKKWKKNADDLDTLAAAQDDLRRRTAEAAKIADPEKRAAALKALAAEQEQIMARGKEVFQRLVRDRADHAARETRAALDHMDAARGDLEKGNPGMRAQNEAVERLDNARDRLDVAAVTAPQNLADEQRRKLADKVKAVFERQKAAVAEADRIHGLVAKEKKWDQEYLTDYGDIALVREEPLAAEVRALEKEFAQLPVLARLLNEAATAMDTATKRIGGRVRETDPTLAFDAELEGANDRKVRRPMDLAARRLEQLLDSLKPDDPKAKSQKGAPPKSPPKTPASPPQGGSAQRDLIPAAAQLKVLRSLQAELNQRTAEFAKLHPDSDKLTDEEREELKEIEDAQRDIAALFEQMAKVFEHEKQEKQEGGDVPPPPREVPAKPQPEGKP